MSSFIFKIISIYSLIIYKLTNYVNYLKTKKI